LLRFVPFSCLPNWQQRAQYTTFEEGSDKKRKKEKFAKRESDSIAPREPLAKVEQRDGGGQRELGPGLEAGGQRRLQEQGV
jgi:hypothetical protein